MSDSTKKDIYQVKRITSFVLDDKDTRIWIIDTCDQLFKHVGPEYKPWNFSIVDMIDKHVVWFCYRNKQPVGMMIATLMTSTFDDSNKILLQELLFAKTGTRAAKLLLDVFIDFGNTNANHVITMIGKSSNIKERSLERLGFEKLETLYRLETSNGQKGR